MNKASLPSKLIRIFLCNFLSFAFIISSAFIVNIVHAKTKKLPIEIESFYLKNGLHVVLIPNHRAPVINHSLFYKVGSADSSCKQTGIAHFLEHLMSEGTKKFPKDSYKQIINKLGGTFNAYTSYDITSFYVTIAKEYIEQIMELEADRMINLVFNKEKVEKERQVVLQERRESLEASPFSKVIQASKAAFFWNHPYGKPILGFENHIKNCTIKDLKSFYKKWYGPNNAILVITGDIEKDNIKKLIQKYYGNLKKINLPNRQREIEPNHYNVKYKVEIKDKEINAMYIQRIYKVPNYRTSNIKEVATLELLAKILGDNTFGRLKKSLVEEQGVAHHAGSSYYGDYLDPYHFIITAQIVNQTDLLYTEAVIDAEIKRLISSGVTEPELIKSKKDLQFIFRYENDSLTSISNYIGENLAHGISLEDSLSWLDIIENISKEDIKNAAKKYLNDGPEVTFYTYPISYN